MNISPELINKYLNRECSPEEERLVRDWYDSFDSKEEPAELLNSDQRDSIRKRILENVRSEISRNEEGVKVGGSSRRFYYAVGLVAASLIIAFSAVNQILLKDSAAETIETVVITNNTHILKNHILPDGSSLWLEPETTIRYTLPFVNKYRKVSMKGETFFDIKRDTLHPFIIHTEQFDTRVLGTSFSIRANGKDPSRLSVVSGKVFVYAPSPRKSQTEGLYVLPKQKVIYKENKKQLEKSNGTEAALRIWDRKSFVFNNAPVSEVLDVLRTNFDVKVTIDNSLVNDLTLNADFTGLNLPVILELMNKSLNINLGFEDETIILSEE
ncbi:FecR family protein [Arcticibacter pallidicorallinus]|uniref:FecR family protein n=1 Tax=Arcticibacter pallidicorallinus TaxID=1259464 RepID=A0A2T0TVZ9_9SPHI|nr:FecR family protein [Arcticibacter pallidicorallinus]PRY49882.1 FecR family protein [Arcticibacter pallidicorallinus]